MKSVVPLVLASCVALASGGYEVPMQKANPPKMDPIPTLPPVTERVFMEIEMGGKLLGRIVFGLFGGVAPKAAENFAALCRCDRGIAKHSQKLMCYRDTPIHRVIPNFGIQGGDFVNGDGTGSETVFGEPFEDESFKIKHNRRYMLSAVNSGKKNTNGPQWFINTVKTQWLDGKNVVFGMVLEGLEVMNSIESVGTHIGDPKATITVKQTGSLPLEPEDKKERLMSEKLTK